MLIASLSPTLLVKTGYIITCLRRCRLVQIGISAVKSLATMSVPAQLIRANKLIHLTPMSAHTIDESCYTSIANSNRLAQFIGVWIVTATRENGPPCSNICIYFHIVQTTDISYDWSVCLMHMLWIWTGF